MIKKWITLKSKRVFSHPRLTVIIDTVRLPSGRETEYLRFGAKSDTVMVFAKNKEGKILLQREYSYPPNEILLQAPGGALNEGEPIQNGALREFTEEAQLTGKLTEIGWMYINNRRSNQKMFFFLAEQISPTFGQPDPEESFENVWFTEDEIDNLIRTNEIRNHTLLAGWAFYKAIGRK